MPYLALTAAWPPLPRPVRTNWPSEDEVVQLLPYLEGGARVDALALRGAMESAFGGSDATALWDWKTAYDACEAATVLFLRKYGKSLLRKAGSPAATSGEY